MEEKGKETELNMPRYAADTSVPVERSRAEIESVLIKYGAKEFHTGWQEGKAMIAFRVADLFIRFILPIPGKNERRFTHKRDRHGYEAKRTELQAENAHQQEVRQRWRALLLTVKAKLEAVECGISTLEQEFLAFIVLPNAMTFGEWVMENALPQIRSGKMPLMLSGPKEDIQDAEIVETSAQRRQTAPPPQP
jgi:hypothetical protein